MRTNNERIRTYISTHHLRWLLALSTAVLINACSGPEPVDLSPEGITGSNPDLGIAPGPTSGFREIVWNVTPWARYSGYSLTGTVSAAESATAWFEVDGSHNVVHTKSLLEALALKSIEIGERG